jgi:predicted SAM-dependent methyltransferase
MQLRKIHLACGNNIIDNWENYDYVPKNGSIHIDLLQPLKFESDSIDYIYFEHALEHFDEVDGFKLLVEFHRILKNNAIARIVTPSLDSYLNRYLNWESSENNIHKERFNNQTEFLNYAFFGESINSNIKFLNNLISSEIGHKFIYSKNDLTTKLKRIGFKEIKNCQYKNSDDLILNNLESRPDYNDIILEIKK